LFQSPLSSPFRNTGTVGPDFVNLGEFKVHADFAINGFPDENCFNTTKLANYKSSNLAVGSINRTRVNQILGTTTFSTKRSLIATYVGANAQEVENPGSIISRVQEHPTYHFYALIANIVGPPNICCIELL
jgi:hypothetical protein